MIVGRTLVGRAIEKNGKKERKEANYDFLLKKIRFALAYVRKKQYFEGTDLALEKGSPTSKLRSRNAAHTTDTHTFLENMAVPLH